MNHDDVVVPLPLSALSCLRFVPTDVISDVCLCLPFASMVALSTACGITDDAGWRMLLGDSLRYVWGEVMVRSVDADAKVYVRGVVDRYIKGHDVSLPRHCTSLLELYRIVVWEMAFLRDLALASSVRGPAVLVLASATKGFHQLPTFTLPDSAQWLGFEPNSKITIMGYDFLVSCNVNRIDLSGLSNVTSIGSRFLSSCTGLKSIDLSPLSNVTSIGSDFLSECQSVRRVDLSPMPNITSIGDGFLTRKGWLRETTFLSKTGAKPVPGASAGGG